MVELNFLVRRVGSSSDVWEWIVTDASGFELADSGHPFTTKAVAWASASRAVSLMRTMAVLFHEQVRCTIMGVSSEKKAESGPSPIGD